MRLLFLPYTIYYKIYPTSLVQPKIPKVSYFFLTYENYLYIPDRPGLEQPLLVEEIQRYYLNTLRMYILNQHSGAPRCPVVFAKILAVLTELRTLGTQNSNMCISLKLKNKKLPPFLEEIWDVADVANTPTATTVVVENTSL